MFDLEIDDKLELKFSFMKSNTVKALVSGHPRDGIKMSVTGAGRLREWFS